VSSRPPVSVVTAALLCICASAAAISCTSSAPQPADSADAADQARCAAGTRFERRLEACVADAPDDEGPDSWCTDQTPRPTREIMGEVQDMEHRRTTLPPDDPGRGEVTRALVKGYEELGCATSREASEAAGQIKALKGSDPDQAERLQVEAERARRISKAAREAAVKYRREPK